MNLRAITDRFALCDVGFAVLCVVCVSSIVLAQFAWLIVLDSTRLDRFVPSVALYVVLPVLTVAVPPAVLGSQLYTTKRAAGYTALIVGAALVLSLATAGLFAAGSPPPRQTAVYPIQ